MNRQARLTRRCKRTRRRRAVDRQDVRPMKDYANAIVARLKDSESWPGTALLGSFNELQAQAQSALERKTLEGNLAAMILMHQIAEDLLRAIDEDVIFYTQLRLYPYPYNPVRRIKRMFGQILQDMESTVWFPNKKYIIERAHKLNDIRIPIVHGLTKPGAIRAVEKNVEKAWEIYKSFAWLAIERHLCFHSDFSEFQDNESWPPTSARILNEDGSWEE